MALDTGLRHGELAQLQWGDVHLDEKIPHVRVRASTTKNGKLAMIPLHQDVVEALRELHGAGKAANETVFERMPRIERFRRDLKKANIPYKDAQGNVVDFHALRKTFGTNMAKAGVPSRVAMEAMRHSDRRLTDEIYTDEKMLNTEPAIHSLPSYRLNSPTGRGLKVADPLPLPLPHTLDPNGHNGQIGGPVSSPSVPKKVVTDVKKDPINIDGKCAMSSLDTSGQKQTQERGWSGRRDLNPRPPAPKAGALIQAALRPDLKSRLR